MDLEESRRSRADMTPLPLLDVEYSHGTSKRRRSSRNIRPYARPRLEIIVDEPKPSSKTRLQLFKSRLPILSVCLLLFAVIVSTGVVLINVVYNSSEKSRTTEVSTLAAETGAFFAGELDKATLPLFSMAQFATELDIFSQLADRIGPLGGEGSAPVINSTDGRLRRNVTGICDQSDVVEKFNKIANTSMSNARLNDVLHSMQFAPYGVVCLTYPLVYTDFSNGLVLNNTSAQGIDLLNDPVQRYIARESMKHDSVGIVGPRTLLQCADCGLYFVARIPVVSATNVIYIDDQPYDRWGFATALIQWERLVNRSGIFEKFKSQGYQFQLTRTDRIFNATTNSYSETVVVLANSSDYGSGSRKEIVKNLQTTNNEWRIAVQYSDSNRWKSWAIAISVFVAFCISVLVYIVLIQKQNHTLMKGETMVQEAKVNIERNMTAYFAHELRNPLCAIDSALLSMPDGLPNEAKELIHGMQLCSTFMSSIMNNLLDVRKMEEGKLVVRSEPLSLSKLAHNIYAMTLPTMKPNVKLLEEIETEGRDWVIGDIHRLEQIMYNLVSNGIKYTRSGSVTIYAGWDKEQVRLECQDTGPGIPKDEQENMFERFTQRGGAPGSGLGLAIAKNLVTLMGGSIHFDSDPTVRPGTNCIVLLPLKPCDAPVDMDKVDEALPLTDPLKVLIIDDIKMNRSMLIRRFQKSIAPNCVITEATTGEESLTLCEKESYDVIIVDQYMHEAGGVMVGTDAIIAMRRLKVQSVIIGCSGNDLDAKFIAAGADLIWKKPMPSNSEIILQLHSALAAKRLRSNGSSHQMTTL
jgi:signal transduction histidine kinase/CheY-like chemotaxis protein